MKNRLGIQINIKRGENNLKPENCTIKIRSKHSSNTLLSLLRFFMRQLLIRTIEQYSKSKGRTAFPKIEDSAN